MHPAAEAAFGYVCYSVVYEANAGNNGFIVLYLDLVLFVCVGILSSYVCRHLVSVLRVGCWLG